MTATVPAADRFTIPGIVRIEASEGKLPRIVITNRFAEAHVYLMGGHVAHFQPVGEAQPVLWMSPKSPFLEGKAIRGGVPVCWPWFGPHPTRKDTTMHGVARFRSWELISTAQLGDGRTRIELELTHSEATLVVWPHEFALRLTVTVGSTLEVALTTTNAGRAPFIYDDALHTYFAVGDVRNVSVTGFEGVPYIERIPAVSRQVQSGTYAFAGETNRVYLGDSATATIHDATWNRRIVVTKSGSRASVLWNPWSGTGMTMPEIAELWPNFVCLETANCLDVPVTLLPGTAHTTTASYGVER